MTSATICSENSLIILGYIDNDQSVSKIVDELGISKKDVMDHIKSLRDEQLITEDKFRNYCAMTSNSTESIVVPENPILDYFRQNVPPMRISEKLGISRQAVYSYLSAQRKKNVITDEEYEKRSRIWKRKHTFKFEDFQENLERVVAVLKDNPDATSKELCEKLEISMQILKRVVTKLYNDGEVSKNRYHDIACATELKNAEREKLIKKLCAEYKDTSFKKLSTKYGMTVRGVILLVEAGIPLGYASQDEYDSVVKSRRTNKRKLSDRDALEIYQRCVNENQSINSVAQEFDRCPTIIRKYINEQKHTQA